MWGLVRFIYDRARGNDKELARDKKGMMWGLGALFVFVTVWGIIEMAQGILGIKGDNSINLPRICTNGSCDTVKSDTPAQGGVTGTFKDKPKVTIVVGDTESINIPAGEACTAGATTQGFICDIGLSCRDKVTGGPLSSGEGICKPIGIQKGERCLASLVSEQNMCGEGLSCQDENRIELRGNKQGTCKLASDANTSSNNKKAPGATCTVLAGGNSNTECTEGYYCKSSTQVAGSNGKCTILP